jgi:hypothetical protein
MEWRSLFLSVFRGVLWSGKAILLIVIVAATFALLVLLSDLQGSGDSKLPASAVAAWLIVVGLGVVLAVLFFVTRAVIRFFRAPPGTWNLFGDTAESRLIGLGAVTLIYPKAIVWLVTVPILTIGQLFMDLPQVITRVNPLAPADESGTLSLEQISSRLILLLQGTANEVVKALYRLFERVSVAEVILALALWVIIGQLLSIAPGSAPDGASGLKQVRVIAYLRNLSESQRRYLWIGLVFFAGIYLSIAAIVAIPWLEEDKNPQNLTRERLEKALLTLVPKSDDVDLNVVAKDAAGPPDPLLQLDESLKETLKRLNDAKDVKEPWAQQNASFITDEIGRAISTVRGARTALHERQTQLQENIRRRRSQIVNEALAAFDSETMSPMSVQERALFFRDIQRTAQRQASDMQGAMNDCAQAVSVADKQVESFARDSNLALSKLSQTTLSPSGSRFWSHDMIGLSMSRGCTSMSLGPSQYEPPDPGATWGPFAVVSQWLLRTKSHALTLITGMLGFGLLGASIATFIRPSAQASISSPAGDAATTIIRGLSAAIVIFLAAKGGLAIVSSSEAEPNAYVLFFTCLVGAVFSESVWEWAKVKLGGSLVNDNDARSKPRNGATSIDAAAVPPLERRAETSHPPGDSAASPDKQPT